MCVLNIKGLRFYGRYNDEHFKALFKLAEVLDKNEIKDIKGVYGTDGKRIIEKNKAYSSAHYITFTRNSQNSCAKIYLTYADKSKETIKLFKSPVILIDGALCHTEYDFIFCILHEIGHHLNDKRLDTKMEKEIHAHVFAINKIKQIYKQEKIPITPYLYLEEALKICG